MAYPFKSSVDEYVGEVFPDLEIPAILAESLARHRENLSRMIANLRLAGLQEDQIEMSVSVLVESYKQELTAAIKKLLR